MPNKYLWFVSISLFNFLYCSQPEVTLVPFSLPTCVRPAIFQTRPIELPLLGVVNTTEFGLHVYALAIFSSFVAPFGGFLASGIKRGLHMKDFSDLLPGHGGASDRFDCHIVMMAFTNVYIRQVVYGGLASLSTVLYHVGRMRKEDQLVLLQKAQAMFGVGGLDGGINQTVPVAGE